jgi:hypothetical protein
MAERPSKVGISNREAPDEEARDRQRHPIQAEREAAQPAEDEPQSRDVQSSSKSGVKTSSQKTATTRDGENTAPSSGKVQGAFGKEQSEG